MATYSVWNWNTLRYRYYETTEPSNLGGWKPLTGLGMAGKAPDATSVGMDIEAALPELPMNARFIGEGVAARGRIARMPAQAARGPAAPQRLQPFQPRSRVRPAMQGLRGPEDGLLTEKLLPAILPKGKFNEDVLAAFLAGFALARLVGKFKFAVLAAAAGTAFLVGSKAKEKWLP